MQNEWDEPALRAWIIKTLESRCGSSNRTTCSDLTVGLEHEFFLTDERGAPATHEQSQSFLIGVSEYCGWYIRSQELEKGINVVLSVSHEDGNGKYSTVKYDHHPHLIEVAFSYYSSLEELARLIDSTFEMLNEVAMSLRLRISNKSILEISPLDPRVTSKLKYFEALRFYRHRLIQAQEHPVPIEYINYAAVIAATQTHIGGTQWWKRAGFVNTLYLYEPAILLLSSDDSHQSRWRGYESVFRGFPLVGFPKISEWSIESWILAMFQSPLSGGADSSWSARILKDLSEFPFRRASSPWGEFISSVRDLQIIRPKLFGTLEFRADPAQASASLIKAILALRLGLCSNLLGNENHEIQKLSVAHRTWWENVSGGDESGTSQQAAISLLSKANDGLAARNLGEEKYLDPLFSRVTKRKSA
jgi:hypothetical protein